MGIEVRVRISADDIRRLLDTENSVLVVVAGRAEVIDATELDDGRLRGALEVATHDDLIAQLGSAQLSDRELDEQAQALTVAVADLGG